MSFSSSGSTCFAINKSNEKQDENEEEEKRSDGNISIHRQNREESLQEIHDSDGEVSFKDNQNLSNCPAYPLFLLFTTICSTHKPDLNKSKMFKSIRILTNAEMTIDEISDINFQNRKRKTNWIK